MKQSKVRDMELLTEYKLNGDQIQYLVKLFHNLGRNNITDMVSDNMFDEKGVSAIEGLWMDLQKKVAIPNCGNGDKKCNNPRD